MGALAARRSLEMTIFGKRMLIFRKIFYSGKKEVKVWQSDT